MRAIDRKLVRDMVHMWGQILAICAVIACGVATFVMSLSALDALQTSQTTYYDRYRFADVELISGLVEALEDLVHNCHRARTARVERRPSRSA